MATPSTIVKEVSDPTRRTIILDGQVRVADDGPDIRFVGRFQVSGVGSRRKRAVAAVHGGQGSCANS